MKWILSICAFSLAFALPALVLCQPEAGVAGGDAIKDVGSVVDAVRSGSAIAIAATVITLLVNLLKAPWLGGVVQKIPKRWRIAIPIALGGIAGILSGIMGGMPWTEAIMVGLFSGPTAVFAHEAVVEAILGRAKSRGPTGPDVLT